MCVCVCVRAHTCSVAQSCPTLQAHGLYVATQAPLGFPRQEYRSRLPFPTQGDLPHSGPTSHASSAMAGGFFTTSATWEVYSLLLRELCKGFCYNCGFISPCKCFCPFLFCVFFIKVHMKHINLPYPLQ